MASPTTGPEPAPAAQGGFRVERYRWTILAVGAFGAGAFSMLRMGLPAIGPEIRNTYGLDLGETGLLLTAVALGVAVTVMPWGILSDRVGERPVLAGGLAGTAIALVLAALLPGVAGLAVGLVLAGMFGSAATGASGRAVMGWFPRRERGLALGIRQMALPLGGALGSILLPVVALAYGIPAAMVALAVAVGIGAVASGLWLRDAPPAPANAQPPVQGSLLRDRRLVRLSLASALLVVGQAATLGFLAIFLHDERGFSVAAAGFVLAGALAIGAVARIVVGRLSDRHGLRVPTMRAVALAAAIGLLGSATLVQAPGALLYPVLGLGVVAAMSWNGLSFTAAAELAGRARSGAAVSLQNTIVAVGSIATPPVFGLLVELTGWAPALAIVGVTPLGARWVLQRLGEQERETVAARERRLAARPSPAPST